MSNEVDYKYFGKTTYWINCIYLFIGENNYEYFATSNTIFLGGDKEEWNKGFINNVKKEN